MKLSKEVRKGAAVLFVFAFLATAFIGVGFESSAAQPPVFKTMNLSNDANTATDPSVWNVGSHVYVAWTEGSHGVFFRESPDNGTTWVPPISSAALKISSHTGTTQYPLISANGTNVYVTWSQTSGAGTFLQVWFATSTNYGQSFNPAVQLSNTNDPNGAITPVIASWGSFVVVGWTANSTSFVTSSSNGGKTWNSTYNIPGSFHEPQVAVWGTLNAYVVSDRGYAYTHDGGLTWNSVTTNTDVHAEPWVWAWGSNVYLVGEGKQGTSQIEFTHSMDNGTTFPPEVNISSSLNDVWAPMLWAYGNNVWVAYHNNPGGPKGQEYIQTSHDNGSTFSSPVSLSGPGLTVGFPFTVWSSDGQNVWVGWPQEIGTTGNWLLRVAYSTDTGNTWTSPPGLNASLNSVGQASNQNDVATGAISAFGQTVFAAYQYIPNSGV